MILTRKQNQHIPYQNAHLNISCLTVINKYVSTIERERDREREKGREGEIEFD